MTSVSGQPLRNEEDGRIGNEVRRKRSETYKKFCGTP
jgi:hypothetical protein